MPKRKTPTSTTTMRPARKIRKTVVNHDVKVQYLSQSSIVNRGKELAGVKEYKDLLCEAIQIVCDSVVDAPSYVPRGAVGEVLRDVLGRYESTTEAMAAVASAAGRSKMVVGDDSVIGLKDERRNECKSSCSGSEQRNASDAMARKGADAPQSHAKLRPRRAVTGLSAHRAPLLAVDSNYGVQSAIASHEQSCASKQQQQHSIVQNSRNDQGTEANPTSEFKSSARNKTLLVAAFADIHAPVLIVEPKEQLEIWTRLLKFEAKLQVDTNISARNLLAIEKVLEEFVDGEMKTEMQLIDGQGFGIRWEKVLWDVDNILGKYRGGKIEKAWWREFRMWRYLVKK